MARLMAALITALITPSARLQAAFTVWLLKGLVALVAATWRAAARGLVTAIGMLADKLYPEPDPRAFDELLKGKKPNSNGEEH